MPRLLGTRSLRNSTSQFARRLRDARVDGQRQQVRRRQHAERVLALCERRVSSREGLEIDRVVDRHDNIGEDHVVPDRGAHPEVVPGFDDLHTRGVRRDHDGANLQPFRVVGLGSHPYGQPAQPIAPGAIDLVPVHAPGRRPVGRSDARRRRGGHATAGRGAEQRLHPQRVDECGSFEGVLGDAATPVPGPLGTGGIDEAVLTEAPDEHECRRRVGDREDLDRSRCRRDRRVDTTEFGRDRQRGQARRPDVLDALGRIDTFAVITRRPGCNARGDLVRPGDDGLVASLPECPDHRSQVDPFLHDAHDASAERKTARAAPHSSSIFRL